MPSLDGFNAESHEPLGDFSALPKGDYLAMATESEMKETKAKDGERLVFTWEIIEDGPKNNPQPGTKGRKLWAGLNLVNPNAKAVEIAQRELSSICRAVGVLQPKESEELHGKPVILKVAVGEYNGQPNNEIKGYSSADGKAATPATTASTSAAPPWKK